MNAAGTESTVRDIEDAFVAHWSLLGRWPGGRLLDEDGVLRFETPLRKLPYNGVLRTTISGSASDVVARIADAYVRRACEFFWVVHPSATPDALPEALSAAGLAPVETAVGMSLDLDGRERPTGRKLETVEFVEVVDDEALRAYEDLVITYWELEEEDREQVSRLNRYWSGPRARRRRWLALVDGEPVGKAYLSLAGPPGVASIYRMSVLPEARGKGIAGGLTQTLVEQAHELGCRRIVLHATTIAVGVYRRASFVERCTFTFYATSPIWSGQH